MSSKEYFLQVSTTLWRIDSGTLKAIIERLKQAREEDASVFLLGNGGSAATASHAANDLLKMGRLRSICVNDMVPTILAYGNDNGWESNMSRILLALAFAAVILAGTFIRVSSATTSYDDVQVFRPPSRGEVAERQRAIPDVEENIQQEVPVKENQTQDTKPAAAPVVAEVETIGTVSAYLLNVRSGPGVEHGILQTISLQDKVIVHQERNGWVKIETASGSKGWVDGSYILVKASFEMAEAEPRDVPLSPNACSSNCWISNDTYFSPAPQHIIGRAVMYAPHVMEGSARVNGYDLTGFVGGVAMASAADQGQVVWLRRDGVNWEGPYLVVDVSSRGGVWIHIVDRHQSVEVDFPTALRWGMADIVDGSWRLLRGGTLDVEVYKGLIPPVDSTRADATVYRDYFLGIARFGSTDHAETRLWTIAYSAYISFEEYQTTLQEAGLFKRYLALSGQ